jgi:tetratricopeptide (TPR) repeat protein
MQKTIRLTFTFAAVGLLALAATGCSSKARKARHLARADRYFASGLYDQAEVEYKNVLQMGALDPQAVARLGCIYFDQDRRTRAAPFLLKARELQPDNLEARLKLGTLYLVSGKPSSIAGRRTPTRPCCSSKRRPSPRKSPKPGAGCEVCRRPPPMARPCWWPWARSTSSSVI